MDKEYNTEFVSHLFADLVSELFQNFITLV